MSDWKPELDAIIGARHGGQVDHVLDLLQKLDARFPHVPEIAYQLAWTSEVLGREAEAVPHYERAISLGLAPNELAGALAQAPRIAPETVALVTETLSGVVNGHPVPRPAAC
jgi:hypothetical protein